MCALESIGLWIGALSTFGLFVLAVFGLNTWRTQFFRKRDHDLAVRILNSITNSYVVFDALRAPHRIFSDGEPPPPPQDAGQQAWYSHNDHFQRYKVRELSLARVREERSAPVLEAAVVWDQDKYGVELGDLVNQLSNIENQALNEARVFVRALRPDLKEGEAPKVDKSILYAPMDADAEDKFGSKFEDVRDNIIEHLRPKLTMK